MKNEKAKPTFEELIEAKKRELELQKADIEALTIIADEIISLAERYTEQYQGYFTTRERVGYEEEQAVNDDGELLFYEKENTWRTGTAAYFANKGITEYEPYHRPIYEDREVTFEEMSEYTKSRALAYKKLAEFFCGLDIKNI